MKYGLPHAINIGDYLFTKVFEALLLDSFSAPPDRLVRLFELMRSTLDHTHRGQALDMNAREGGITVDHYMQLVTEKTGHYLAAPMIAGGVEANALYGLKRLFGAARNVENGGSLTIIATVVVDSSSATDQLLFEEVDGTENLEIRLRRDLAEERAFPAIDVVASGTRHADLLTSGEEAAILDKLDAELAELTPEDAHRSLLERLGRSRTNIEFLMGVQRS